jgi:hypothetical protein
MGSLAEPACQRSWTRPTRAKPTGEPGSNTRPLKPSWTSGSIRPRPGARQTRRSCGRCRTRSRDSGSLSHLCQSCTVGSRSGRPKPRRSAGAKRPGKGPPAHQGKSRGRGDLTRGPLAAAPIGVMRSAWKSARSRQAYEPPPPCKIVAPYCAELTRCPRYHRCQGRVDTGVGPSGRDTGYAPRQADLPLRVQRRCAPAQD